MNLQEAKKLENKVSETLKKHLKKGDTIVIGVSGGPDSILLLHLLVEFQKETPIKIVTAHVNHLLRKDSDTDEKFLKGRIKDLYSIGANVVLYTKKSDIKKLSKQNKKGIEETGRKVRYEFFQELARKYKAKFITTAHHADDNLETIILNLTRGATLKGLSGMQEIDQITEKTILLRPLLDLSKEEILSYLKLKKIRFRIDKSNTTQIYRRNTIRQKIAPQLKKLNPSITETTAKNAKILREINDFLEKEAEKWIKKNSSPKNSLNAKPFRNLHPALQKTVILKYYKNYIGNTKNLENIHIEEVLKLINQNIGNKRKKLGKLTFSLKNNIINIAKTAKKVHY